ncbi:MAG: 16S rRNA (guanine(966)-N(2))-methyltransferase RsmD [Planctomycetota bacterium]
MRIITGRFRGRRLVAPEGEDTRPMLGRVKESLFSILGDEVDGARVLDLFSGSGGLGLEALSRGAASVRFVEQSAAARKALRRNCDAFGVTDEEVEHAPGDALLADAWRRPDGARWADLAFLDPPYPIWRTPGDRATMLAVVRKVVDEALVPGGLLVLHTHPSDLEPSDLGLDDDAEPRVYGNSALWFVRAAEE